MLMSVKQLMKFELKFYTFLRLRDFLLEMEQFMKLLIQLK